MEYTIGDMAPAGMSRANVRVQAQLGNGYNPDYYSGKINTLIGDVRVGRHVVTDDEVESYTVAVPRDCVLSIEVVKRQIIRTPNNQSVNNHWDVLRFANREPSHKISHEVDGHQVQLDIINWENNIDVDGVREFVSP